MTRRGFLRRVVTTLVVWTAAYLVVGALFVFAGSLLERAPTALRLLVISGVLVIMMVNFLMPFINKLVSKLFP